VVVLSCASYFDVENVRMKKHWLTLFSVLLIAGSLVSDAQSTDLDHLSKDEIATAVAAKPNSGFVYIEDAGFTVPTDCQVQMPSEAVFTPLGWINAKAAEAKRSYLSFSPDPEDTARVLTVISKGCVNGTAAGPVCDTVSRVVLLSDRAGTAKVESLSQKPLAQAWQNGYGASANCSALLSRFSMDQIQHVRNSKGEFLIATFSGSTLLKIYTVKDKHLKKLGI
jgi:hypothetical protein